MILRAKMFCAEMAIAKDTLSIRAYRRLATGFEITTPHCRWRHLRSNQLWLMVCIISCTHEQVWLLENTVVEKMVLVVFGTGQRLQVS